MPAVARRRCARRAGVSTDGMASVLFLTACSTLNIRTYLVDDRPPKADWMSTAHALNVRSSFRDPDVTELSLRLPPGHKARGLTLKRQNHGHVLWAVLTLEVFLNREGW